MNIEKLAKHLKEFTLDEIEMIAECDCKTELCDCSQVNKNSTRTIESSSCLKIPTQFPYN